MKKAKKDNTEINKYIAELCPLLSKEDQEEAARRLTKHLEIAKCIIERKNLSTPRFDNRSGTDTIQSDIKI
jgi:hypothetical protein